MTTKFTPGPWHLVLSNNATPFIQHELGYDWTDIDDRESRVCVMPVEILESYNSLNNARLIAAAPDGYKAAESAYLTLLKVRTFEDRLSDGFQESLIRLRDFIAKATNRSSEDVQNEFEAKARGEQL